MSNTLNTNAAASRSTGEETLDEEIPPVLERTADHPAPPDPPPAELPLEAQAPEPEPEAASIPEAVGAAGLEEAQPDLPPVGAGSEVRQFIAMLRRERKARARARRLKRLGWAVAAATLAGYVAARSNHPDAPGALPMPGAMASPSRDLPPAPQPSPADFELAVPGEQPDQAGEATQCEESFTQQRWRSAVETCTRVFEQTPGAALALRIGHAHYARGQATPAGFWARTALGLGSKDADAYVLIGHSERQAGHTKNAVDAYRRYLQSSPRGWHARRLREALRELAPRPAHRQPSARRTTERTL
jgi:hypothetical protein